jgi:hypothetical protein
MPTQIGQGEHRKSTFGCCFTLGSAMVSWCNRKQTYVALSTAEAEYIALCVAVCEALWLRKLLADLFGNERDSTIIHCNNQSCLKLSENPNVVKLGKNSRVLASFTSFSKKRVFAEFLGKNSAEFLAIFWRVFEKNSRVFGKTRQKLAGRWEKLAHLNFLTGRGF